MTPPRDAHEIVQRSMGVRSPRFIRTGISGISGDQSLETARLLARGREATDNYYTLTQYPGSALVLRQFDFDLEATHPIYDRIRRAIETAPRTLEPRR